MSEEPVSESASEVASVLSRSSHPDTARRFGRPGYSMCHLPRTLELTIGIRNRIRKPRRVLRLIQGRRTPGPRTRITFGSPGVLSS